MPLATHMKPVTPSKQAPARQVFSDFHPLHIVESRREVCNFFVFGRWGFTSKQLHYVQAEK